MTSTSDVAFLLKGLTIGFSIAAPVGPIGVLVIRRTLAHGRASGLVSGLGAATADSVYGSVAAFGLTAVSALLLRHEPELRFIGGLFLVYLGVRTFLARPAEREHTQKGETLTEDYFSTLALTLTNPMTILSFAAIFTGLGLVHTAGRAGAAGAMVLGVFAGSAAWWLALTAMVGAASHWVTPKVLRWVNRVSGIVIAAFGAVVLAGRL